MSSEAIALVCSQLNGSYEPRSVHLGDVREDEILVRMVATGVCHTDFACTNGSIPVSFPFIGGHEGAGVVERVGSKIDHVEVDDHVLLTFSSCGQCVNCTHGSPAYCINMRELNFRGSRADGSTAFALADGSQATVSSHFFGQSSFATRAVVRGRSAIKVDKTLPLEMLCSLGCGMQTGAGTVLNVLKPELGSTIAIFGAGAVGMGGLMAARLTPAAKIIMVDILDSKLEVAKQLGATDVINSTKVNVVEEIRRLTAGRGVDLAFDATGKIGVIRDMIDCASPGGLVVTVGAPPMGQTLEIEPATWLARGVKYMGAHQGSSVSEKFIPLLIQFWKTGRFPVEKITKVYQYTEIEKAHKDLVEGRCVKGVLRWS